MTVDRSLRILVVDDEDIVREVVCQFLEELGHRVETVCDGTAALEVIEGQDEYDLAFIDVRLPGVDGLELLSRSRQIRPQMPVIMITGHGGPAMSERALGLGAADFLIKPIRLLELDALMEKVCPNP